MTKSYLNKQSLFIIPCLLSWMLYKGHLADVEELKSDNQIAQEV